MDRMCINVIQPMNPDHCSAAVIRTAARYVHENVTSDNDPHSEMLRQQEHCGTNSGACVGPDTPQKASDLEEFDNDCAAAIPNRPLPRLPKSFMVNTSRAPDVLQLDLMSSRQARADVHAKLIAKSLCKGETEGAGELHRARPRSTPAALLGQSSGQREQAARFSRHDRRVQTAHAAVLAARPCMQEQRVKVDVEDRRALSARAEDAPRCVAVGEEYGCQGDEHMHDTTGSEQRSEPSLQRMLMSSPGLAAAVPYGSTDAATRDDALSMRIRPGSGTSHAPRGAILYYAALELESAACEEHAGNRDGGDRSCQHGAAGDSAGDAPQRTRAAVERPKSARTVSSVAALQALGCGHADRHHRDMPEAAKTRMMLRDASSQPRAAVAERLGQHIAHGGGVWEDPHGLQGMVLARPEPVHTGGAGGARSRQRLKVPTAVEGRYLRERVLESSLQRRCQSAARQRARSATLPCQMRQLWGNLERAKPRLRQPQRVKAQFNEELPEWDRWRSLILVPTKSFQVAQRPIRSE
eukprot:jgi/Ulvmu1/1581/UM111_0009.1